VPRLPPGLTIPGHYFCSAPPWYGWRISGRIPLDTLQSAQIHHCPLGVGLTRECLFFCHWSSCHLIQTQKMILISLF
jgi:hypothetical protein